MSLWTGENMSFLSCCIIRPYFSGEKQVIWDLQTWKPVTMDMSQEQTRSVSLPRSLRKRKKGSDMTNMFQRTCRLEINVPSQIVHVIGTELKVIVGR